MKVSKFRTFHAVAIGSSILGLVKFDDLQCVQVNCTPLSHFIGYSNRHLAVKWSDSPVKSEDWSELQISQELTYWYIFLCGGSARTFISECKQIHLESGQWHTEGAVWG